eukprot:g27404.t1
MKLCFLLAVISTARKLVDPAPFPRGKLNAGIDLDGVEAERVDQSRVWRLSASHQRCRAQEAQLRRQQKDVCDMSTAMATNQHETCQAFQDLDVFPEGVPVESAGASSPDESRQFPSWASTPSASSSTPDTVGFQAWAVAEGLCANQTARATQSAGDCKAAGASVVSKGENCTEIQRTGAAGQF